MNNDVILADPKSDALILPGQNIQPGAVPDEPWKGRNVADVQEHIGNDDGAVPDEPGKERNSEELPSIDDPFLRETLQYYVQRGQLARQSKESEQSGA